MKIQLKYKSFTTLERILTVKGSNRTQCEFKLHSFRDNPVFFNLDEFQIVLQKTPMTRKLIENEPRNYNVWDTNHDYQRVDIACYRL